LVQEWHPLCMALKVVCLNGEDEFEDVKRRATKKLTIVAAFTTNRKVRLREVAYSITSPPTVMFLIAPEERQQLRAVPTQYVRPAIKER
jgi:hypothetical protein